MEFFIFFIYNGTIKKKKKTAVYIFLASIKKLIYLQKSKL